ncbi:MAG: ATP-dependent endonuclease [Planctomycetota bacterium]
MTKGELRIDAIALDTPDFENYFNGMGDRGDGRRRLESLAGLSRVNVFVGANNSGKSRFLRAIATQWPLQVQPAIPGLEQDFRDMSHLLATLRRQLEGKGISQVATVAVSDIPWELSPFTPLDGGTTWPGLRQILPKIADLKARVGGDFSGSHAIHDSVARRLGAATNQEAAKCQRILRNCPELLPKPRRVYVPTLRGLRRFSVPGASNALFREQTAADYFADRAPDEIFTGLELNSRVRQMLLGFRPEREIIDRYQRFLSKTFFGGDPVTLIPHDDQQVLYLTIGTEKERPIHSVGDGIAQAITISFLPFVQQEPAFFFVEEPEVHMHPGLQRKVLDFMTSEACTQHHFFLTTHSNHLLDMSMDFDKVTIFNFIKQLPQEGANDKVAQFYVRPVNRGDRSSLQLLGVRNSSVFLVNATIWVEGITDRLYLRKLLALYQDHMEGKDPTFTRVEEDVHFSFVEYGGANLKHWSFLESEESEDEIEVAKLCGAALLVADRDEADWKRERQEELQKKLGDRFRTLPCREIENLLPPRVIKEIVEEWENRASPDNTVGVRAPSQDEYADPPLGRFIQEKLLNGTYRRKGGYAAKSGTLKGKVDFCRKALEKLNSLEEFSPQARDLAQVLYGHVLKQNAG